MDLNLQIYTEAPGGGAKEGRGGSRIPLGGGAKHRSRECKRTIWPIFLKTAWN